MPPPFDLAADPPADAPGRRRNPDASASPRRGGGWDLPMDVRRARLWRRWGWPRGVAGWKVGRGAGRSAGHSVGRGAWFLGVDVALASDLWVARVHALPPRPRGSPHAAAGRAWLAALEALRPQAAAERRMIAARVGAGWPGSGYPGSGLLGFGVSGLGVSGARGAGAGAC